MEDGDGTLKPGHFRGTSAPGAHPAPGCPPAGRPRSPAETGWVLPTLSELPRCPSGLRLAEAKWKPPPCLRNWAWDSELAACVRVKPGGGPSRRGWRPRGGGVVAAGSSLLMPAFPVLVQFLLSSRAPSFCVLRAEVGTEAIRGGRGGRLRTALERRPVGVQILLCKVGVHFCKPAEVSWKDKGTVVTGTLGMDA